MPSEICIHYFLTLEIKIAYPNMSSKHISASEPNVYDGCLKDEKSYYET